MPRGDRRGPEGRGSMTGRGLGYCAENNQPGYQNDAASQEAARGLRNGTDRGPGCGCGCGRGRGMGHGRGFVGRARGFYSPSAAENENESELINKEENKDREVTRLENLANTLSNELEIVKNKIDELKNN